MNRRTKLSRGDRLILLAVAIVNLMVLLAGYLIANDHIELLFAAIVALFAVTILILLKSRSENKSEPEVQE